MKKIVNTNVLNKARRFVLLSMFLFMGALAFAQSRSETAKPLYDMEVVRKVAILDIEGTHYEDVIISFKSVAPDYFISDKYKVKVKVVDKNGKLIYKKTLKNIFLYVFSNGEIKVSNNGFCQILIIKSELSGDNIGMIREWEGIY